MPSIAFESPGFNTPETQRTASPRFPEKEMRALFALGFHIIPCGGENGKKPMRRGWNKSTTKRLPIDTCIEIMRLGGSSCYGIRLDNLTVVDCDSWNLQTADLIADRFPTSTFAVETARGLHLYFAANDPIPKNIKTGPVQIDFKSGHNHFVIGPGSVRPDGAVYVAQTGDMASLSRLVDFKDKIPALQETAVVVPTSRFTADLVPVGKRDRALFRFVISEARECGDLESLRDAATRWVHIHCADPETMTATEIAAKCNWAWRKRQAGKLYTGQQSEFRISRAASAIINAQAGAIAGNCMLTYTYLLQHHGHRPNAPFGIVAEAIANSGNLALSKSTIDRCKQMLKKLGLIKIFRKGRFKQPDLYVLTPFSRLPTQTSPID